MMMKKRNIDTGCKFAESMVYCVILAEYIREMQKRGKGNRFMSREEVLQAKTVQRVGLIIIFNHKYNGNLPLLRKLYSSRFSYIRFLSPFYEGSDKDVLIQTPVRRICSDAAVG